MVVATVSTVGTHAARGAVTTRARSLSARELTGVVAATLWLPIDGINGLNLGWLGVVATFVAAPVGMVIGASSLGRLRWGQRARRGVARATLVGGATGTTFALWLLATR